VQQIDLIRDCCNKHSISDIVNQKVDVRTITWLASQVPNMLEYIDYQAKRLAKFEANYSPLMVDQPDEDSVPDKCSDCRCTSSDVDLCEDVRHARRWLIDSDELEDAVFEDAVVKYTSLHPGKFRPFMMAWCDLFGGI